MSTRLTALEHNKTTGKTKELLDGIQAKMKTVPNIMRTLAHSPAALQGYVSFSDALSHGTLSAKLRESIAITVAETNGCEYCLSAHIAIGQSLGLTEQDLKHAQSAKATDLKTDAALKFTRAVVIERGEITDAEFQKIKTAGYSEGEIIEIIANIALNTYTNYFNHIAQTVIDFPKKSLLAEKIS